MGSEVIKICFASYAEGVEDTQELNEVYDKFCCLDSECYDETNSELIETAVYKEREKAFYAGFRIALIRMLDILENIDSYIND